MHIYLLTLKRKLTADQSIDANEVQLGKPMSCLTVTYRNMGKAWHTGADSKTAAS